LHPLDRHSVTPDCRPVARRDFRRRHDAPFAEDYSRVSFMMPARPGDVVQFRGA
jgi:hypothetical protein